MMKRCAANTKGHGVDDTLRELELEYSSLITAEPSTMSGASGSAYYPELQPSVLYSFLSRLSLVIAQECDDVSALCYPGNEKGKDGEEEPRHGGEGRTEDEDIRVRPLAVLVELLQNAVGRYWSTIIVSRFTATQRGVFGWAEPLLARLLHDPLPRQSEDAGSQGQPQQLYPLASPRAFELIACAVPTPQDLVLASLKGNRPLCNDEYFLLLGDENGGSDDGSRHLRQLTFHLWKQYSSHFITSDQKTSYTCTGIDGVHLSFLRCHLRLWLLVLEKLCGQLRTRQAALNCLREWSAMDSESKWEHEYETALFLSLQSLVLRSSSSNSCDTKGLRELFYRLKVCLDAGSSYAPLLVDLISARLSSLKTGEKNYRRSCEPSGSDDALVEVMIELLAVLQFEHPKTGMLNPGSLLSVGMEHSSVIFCGMIRHLVDPQTQSLVHLQQQKALQQQQYGSLWDRLAQLIVQLSACCPPQSPAGAELCKMLGSLARGRYLMMMSGAGAAGEEQQQAARNCERFLTLPLLLEGTTTSSIRHFADLFAGSCIDRILNKKDNSHMLVEDAFLLTTVRWPLYNVSVASLRMEWVSTLFVLCSALGDGLGATCDNINNDAIGDDRAVCLRLVSTTLCGLFDGIDDKEWRDPAILRQYFASATGQQLFSSSSFCRSLRQSLEQTQSHRLIALLVPFLQMAVGKWPVEKTEYGEAQKGYQSSFLALPPLSRSSLALDAQVKLMWQRLGTTASSTLIRGSDHQETEERYVDLVHHLLKGKGSTCVEKEKEKMQLLLLRRIPSSLFFPQRDTDSTEREAKRFAALRKLVQTVFETPLWATEVCVIGSIDTTDLTAELFWGHQTIWMEVLDEKDSVEIGLDTSEERWLVNVPPLLQVIAVLCRSELWTAAQGLVRQLSNRLATVINGDRASFFLSLHGSELAQRFLSLFQCIVRSLPLKFTSKSTISSAAVIQRRASLSSLLFDTASSVLRCCPEAQQQQVRSVMCFALLDAAAQGVGEWSTVDIVLSLLTKGLLSPSFLWPQILSWALNLYQLGKSRIAQPQQPQGEYCRPSCISVALALYLAGKSMHHCTGNGNGEGHQRRQPSSAGAPETHQMEWMRVFQDFLSSDLHHKLLNQLYPLASFQGIDERVSPFLAFQALEGCFTALPEALVWVQWGTGTAGKPVDWIQLSLSLSTLKILHPPPAGFCRPSWSTVVSSLDSARQLLINLLLKMKDEPTVRQWLLSPALNGALIGSLITTTTTHQLVFHQGSSEDYSQVELFLKKAEQRLGSLDNWTTVWTGAKKATTSTTGTEGFPPWTGPSTSLLGVLPTAVQIIRLWGQLCSPQPSSHSVSQHGGGGTGRRRGRHSSSTAVAVRVAVVNSPAATFLRDSLFRFLLPGTATGEEGGGWPGDETADNEKVGETGSALSVAREQISTASRVSKGAPRAPHVMSQSAKVISRDNQRPISFLCSAVSLANSFQCGDSMSLVKGRLVDQLLEFVVDDHDHQFVGCLLVHLARSGSTRHPTTPSVPNVSVGTRAVNRELLSRVEKILYSSPEACQGTLSYILSEGGEPSDEEEGGVGGGGGHPGGRGGSGYCSSLVGSLLRLLVVSSQPLEEHSLPNIQGVLTAVSWVSRITTSDGRRAAGFPQLSLESFERALERLSPPSGEGCGVLLGQLATVWAHCAACHRIDNILSGDEIASPAALAMKEWVKVLLLSPSLAECFPVGLFYSLCRCLASSLFRSSTAGSPPRGGVTTPFLVWVSSLQHCLLDARSTDQGTNDFSPLYRWQLFGSALASLGSGIGAPNSRDNLRVTTRDGGINSVVKLLDEARTPSTPASPERWVAQLLSCGEGTTLSSWVERNLRLLESGSPETVKGSVGCDPKPAPHHLAAATARRTVMRVERMFDALRHKIPTLMSHWWPTARGSHYHRQPTTFATSSEAVRLLSTWDSLDCAGAEQAFAWNTNGGGNPVPSCHVESELEELVYRRLAVCATDAGREADDWCRVVQVPLLTAGGQHNQLIHRLLSRLQRDGRETGSYRDFLPPALLSSQWLHNYQAPVAAERILQQAMAANSDGSGEPAIQGGRQHLLSSLWDSLMEMKVRVGHRGAGWLREELLRGEALEVSRTGPYRSLDARSFLTNYFFHSTGVESGSGIDQRQQQRQLFSLVQLALIDRKARRPTPASVLLQWAKVTRGLSPGKSISLALKAFQLTGTARGAFHCLGLVIDILQFVSKDSSLPTAAPPVTPVVGGGALSAVPLDAWVPFINIFRQYLAPKGGSRSEPQKHQTGEKIRMFFSRTFALLRRHYPHVCSASELGSSDWSTVLLAPNAIEGEQFWLRVTAGAAQQCARESLSSPQDSSALCFLPIGPLGLGDGRPFSSVVSSGPLLLLRLYCANPTETDLPARRWCTLTHDGVTHWLRVLPTVGPQSPFPDRPPEEQLFHQSLGEEDAEGGVYYSTAADVVSMSTFLSLWHGLLKSQPRSLGSTSTGMRSGPGITSGQCVLASLQSSAHEIACHHLVLRSPTTRGDKALAGQWLPPSALLSREQGELAPASGVRTHTGESDEAEEAMALCEEFVRRSSLKNNGGGGGGLITPEHQRAIFRRFSATALENELSRRAISLEDLQTAQRSLLLAVFSSLLLGSWFPSSSLSWSPFRVIGDEGPFTCGVPSLSRTQFHQQHQEEGEAMQVPVSAGGMVPLFSPWYTFHSHVDKFSAPYWMGAHYHVGRCVLPALGIGALSQLHVELVGCTGGGLSGGGVIREDREEELLALLARLIGQHGEPPQAAASSTSGALPTATYGWMEKGASEATIYRLFPLSSHLEENENCFKMPSSYRAWL